jgi:hypothetical protein
MDCKSAVTPVELSHKLVSVGKDKFDSKKILSLENFYLLECV